MNKLHTQFDNVDIHKIDRETEYFCSSTIKAKNFSPLSILALQGKYVQIKKSFDSLNDNICVMPEAKELIINY